MTVATSGLKFKPELPKSATDVLLSQATTKIKNMSPELIDNGKGGKVLVFKDETGAILRNQENKLEPYTAGELVARELKTMGVLDEGRKQPGSGTNPSQGRGGGGGTVVDVSGAKTKVEANNIITTALLGQVS